MGRDLPGSSTPHAEWLLSLHTVLPSVNSFVFAARMDLWCTQPKTTRPPSRFRSSRQREPHALRDWGRHTHLPRWTRVRFGLPGPKGPRSARQLWSGRSAAHIDEQGRGCAARRGAAQRASHRPRRPWCPPVSEERHRVAVSWAEAEQKWLRGQDSNLRPGG